MAPERVKNKQYKNSLAHRKGEVSILFDYLFYLSLV